jgi:phosphonate transport system substrate-binding protein
MGLSLRGLAALTLLACSGEASVAKNSAPALSPIPPYRPPPGLATLRLALTPYLGAEQLLAEREPFREWLTERLGVPVELRVASSYDELGALLESGEVDLAEFSPYAWVRAREKDPSLVPLVSQIADGSTSAAGYVVVRADRPVHTLEELRGRSIAFVDPASTTGYLFPRLLLQDRVVTPGATAFLGNHEAVLLAVHEGRYDAGAVYQGALIALEETHDIDPLDFRVVAKTPRIPRDLLCAGPGVPEVVREELTRLLLDLSVRTAEGRRLLGPMRVNGFVRADLAAYEPIRSAAKKIGAL